MHTDYTLYLRRGHYVPSKAKTTTATPSSVLNWIPVSQFLFFRQERPSLSNTTDSPNFGTAHFMEAFPIMTWSRNIPQWIVMLGVKEPEKTQKTFANIYNHHHITLWQHGCRFLSRSAHMLHITIRNSWITKTWNKLGPFPDNWLYLVLRMNCVL